ncbi:hypothetical protein [Pigmentiphaga litoralis]|uniref:hypothetical protein n=1 Tax=Pigmentiphaga litoralis TaxID=516702 RepID=UPI003B439E0F
MKPDVSNAINAALKRAMAQASVRDTMATLGMQAVGDSPDAFGKYISTEYDRWGKVIKASGLKAE